MTLLHRTLGLAGLVGINLAIAALPASANEVAPAAPQQLAQVPTACPPGFVPETPEPFEPRIGYNLECWDLTRTGIICVNNPNPECGVDLVDSFSYNIPERRYDIGYEDFTCVNNPNPECGNPVRYGALYGSEYESDFLERTASIWADYESSRASRPEPIAPSAPAPAALPPVAPIPGLW